jgi:uncharacterized cupredoxin-like copper-binding protein
LRHRASWAAAPLLLALTATATACGGDRVDRKDLESKIAEYVEKQTGIKVSVDCPDDVSPKKGTQVHCTTVLSGATTDLTVTFTQDGKFRLAEVRPRVD